MTKFSFIIGAFLLVGLYSCQDTPTATSGKPSTQQAFDLVSFLDKQTKVLTQQKKAVKKTVSEAGEAKETKTLPNIDWAEELGSFADADINKPALKGLYKIDSTTNTAGDQVYYYRAKEGNKATVRQLSYSLNRQGQLVQLNATILQENFLFKTHKRLYLEAQPGQLPQLRLYQLEETQKLLFMSPAEYGIVGEVVL